MKAVLFFFKYHLPFKKSDAEWNRREGTSGFFRHPAKTEDFGRKNIFHTICKNVGIYTSNLIALTEFFLFFCFFVF